MVGPQKEIKFHLRYEIMYFLLFNFFFFCTYTWKFGGLRFRVVRLRVLGSSF